MTLTVLTFNVYQLQFKGSRRRGRLALRAIEQADPDVIVLNEVFNRPGRALVAWLHAAGYHATPCLGGFGGMWTGVSGRRRGMRRLLGGGVYVLSRFPIEAQYQHVYRAFGHRTTDALSNKGVVLVALRPFGERLWVAGTHLQADERGNGHPERMAQLAEVRALVAATVPAREGVILAGDLNVEYYHADAEGRPGATGTDWVDAGRAVGGPIASGGAIHDFTFDAAMNPLTRKGFPHTRNVLDYVALIQTGDPPDLSVSTTTLRCEPGQEASDHFPVLATVAATGPRPVAARGACSG